LCCASGCEAPACHRPSNQHEPHSPIRVAKRSTTTAMPPSPASPRPVSSRAEQRSWPAQGYPAGPPPPSRMPAAQGREPLHHRRAAALRLARGGRRPLQQRERAGKARELHQGAVDHGRDVRPDDPRPSPGEKDATHDEPDAQDDSWPACNFGFAKTSSSTTAPTADVATAREMRISAARAAGKWTTFLICSNSRERQAPLPVRRPPFGPLHQPAQPVRPRRLGLTRAAPVAAPRCGSPHRPAARAPPHLPGQTAPAPTRHSHSHQQSMVLQLVHPVHPRHLCTSVASPMVPARRRSPRRHARPAHLRPSDLTTP